MVGSRSATSKFEYIDHIDGIRALAVILVVLYHEKLGFLTGGFVGVDVFFVISGYLITKTIAKAHGREGWVLSFYAARARRIVPAYVVVVAVTMAVACILFLPVHLQKIEASAVSSLLFASNFVFWRTTSYFSPDLTFNPLLHTWSLALEWQFYAVFPIIFAIARINFRFKKMVLMLILMSSLALACVLIWNSKSVPAFYLLPTRLWEFLIGSAVAQADLKNFSKAARKWLLLASAIVLSGCALLYDSHTSFPGLMALPPCLATAVLIKFGHEEGVVNRLLMLRPMRVIGQASYSVYLWHWPIIVFFDYCLQEREGSFGILRFLVLTALSFGVGMMSWKYIETPLRNKGVFSSRRVGVFCSLPVVATLAVLMFVHSTGGFPARFDERVNAIAGEYADTGGFRDCLGRTTSSREEINSLCKLGADKSKVDFIIFGDSHAAALADGISSLAKERGQAGVLVATDACPPLFDFDGLYVPSRKKCKGIQSSMKSIVDIYKPQLLIFHAAWGGYYHHDNDKFKAELNLMADYFARQGVKILFIDDTPGYSENVPILLAKAQAYSWNVELVRTDDFDNRHEAIRHALRSTADKFNFNFVDTSRYLCEAGGDCSIKLNGFPLYWDNAHLTGRASRALVREIFRDLPAAFFPQAH